MTGDCHRLAACPMGGFDRAPFMPALFILFFPSSSAPPGLYPAAFIMHGPGPSLLFNLGPVYIRLVNKKRHIEYFDTYMKY